MNAPRPPPPPYPRLVVHMKQHHRPHLRLMRRVVPFLKRHWDGYVHAATSRFVMKEVDISRAFTFCFARKGARPPSGLHAYKELIAKHGGKC